MPNPTYIQIASYAATGTVAYIEFTSIPNTYTDLKIVWSTRTPNTTPIVDNISTWQNGSTANGSNKVLYTLGGSPASYSDTGTYTSAGTVGGSATANTFSNGEIYIPNYAGSTYKSMSVDTVTENDGATSGRAFTAQLWSQTAALTSLRLNPNYANFTQYSTAYLYGIKNS